MGKSFKNVGNRLIMTLAAAFALVLITAFPVKAASKPSPITGLKQIEGSSTSVEVSWSCLGGSDTRYKVEISEQPSTGYIVVDENEYSSPTWISGLEAGKTYYVRITPFVNDSKTYEKIWGDTSAPVAVVTKPDKAPATFTHTTSTTNSITVEWSAVPGADVYEVEYYTTSTAEMQCITTGTSVTLENLTKNASYTIRVSGGRKYADGMTIAWSGDYISRGNVSVKPSKVSGVEVNYYWQNLSEISVRNSTIECADGYQYQLYTAYKDKDKDSKIKTVTTSSTYPQTYIKTSALKKHNFYKVKVRAYALNSKNEKMYGSWSSWKYVSPQPDVTKAKNNKSKKGIQINWDKIKGANRYVVYVSNKKDSGYKKFQTTTKTGTVITKCGKSKLKSGKTYYFYIAPQKKVGNKYVSGLAGNANYCWKLKYKK